MAQWDGAARKGLAVCAEQTVSRHPVLCLQKTLALCSHTIAPQPIQHKMLMTCCGQGGGRRVLLVCRYSTRVHVHILMTSPASACACSMQISAGAVPLLLLLCCGVEGPPKELLAAAEAAAAAAKCSSSPQQQQASSLHNAPAGAAAEGGDKSDITANGSSSIGPTGKPVYARRSTVSSGGGVPGEPGHAGEALDSIAEPSHVAEGEEDDAASGDGAGDSSSGGSSRVQSAGSGAEQGAGGKKGKKGGKKSKKPAKLEPDMVEAQTQASAAVKLLALSGDAGCNVLLSAGALSVLLPLLQGPVSPARWNARQVWLLQRSVS